ncbi:MAG: hypothetical protein ACOYOU_01630 [Kiritimatiellia bacterium]
MLSAGILAIGLVTWRPHVPAVVSGLLIALLAGWFSILYRSLRARMTSRQAMILLAPKGIIALMLVIAILDPLWTSTVTMESANKLLAVVDVSASMDVKDDGDRSRMVRASASLERIRNQFPSGLGMAVMEFDTALRDVQGRPGATVNRQEIRQTDLGGTLLTLARRADLSSYAGIILLTDGGDEPSDISELPSVPLYVVGVGNDLTEVGDLAIADLSCPLTVEKLAAFEISVDVSARRKGALAARDLSSTAVVLEREREGKWTKEGEQAVNLENGWARSVFKVTCPEPERQQFRATVERLPGEVSHANNSRVISVDVRKKTLHVMFFARELGAELKVLRGELLRDAGVTFTALYRTSGERFTVQGGTFTGDDKLEAGFPTDQEILGHFDCIIIGSVSGSDWQDGQMQALRTYLENGGAVVFLGYEATAGSGLGASILGPLMPWETSERSGDMLHGEFTVGIPAMASSHPVVAGLQARMAQSGGATVTSLSRVGPIRAGATVLLTVKVDRKTFPLVAIQRFGKGNVLAIASNTMWKWARKSPDMAHAYGLLWRQAVRNLASSLEGGQVLSVKWNAETYRPGERAVAEIRPVVPAAEQPLQFTASFRSGGTMKSVPVDPLQGQSGMYAVKYTFEKRGTYNFTLAVRQGNNVLETYEKELPVGSLAGEGSRLELDDAALKRLAQRSGGAYYAEREIDRLVKDLAARHLTKKVTSEIPILSDSPWFALFFVGVLVSEWIVRRKRNAF